jgi:hypothetical protein
VGIPAVAQREPLAGAGNEEDRKPEEPMRNNWIAASGVSAIILMLWLAAPVKPDPTKPAPGYPPEIDAFVCGYLHALHVASGADDTEEQCRKILLASRQIYNLHDDEIRAAQREVNAMLGVGR